VVLGERLKKPLSQIKRKMEDNLKKLKGQYLKADKAVKIKPKGIILATVTHCMFTHIGKMPNHRGAI